MRLINTKTGEFHQVSNPAQVRYAILSHVWHEHGEMSYQDVEHIRLEQSKISSDGPTPSLSLLPHLSAKIRNACALALSEGFSYIWIDTCCIDKTSSAELSEAINSMYAWYAQATVCYAYLEDAQVTSSSWGTSHTVSNRVKLAQPSIVGCKWFTRAWTLQELIAPRFVLFVGADWQPFGTKDSYAEVITSITRIPEDVLRHAVSADSYSVATRMLWASFRKSTRLEDRAYSLMGIFGVHMPTIYGEGENAFRRLQEEILKQDPDQSILVWGSAEVFSSWSAFVEHARNVPIAFTSPSASQFRDPFTTSPDSFTLMKNRSLHPFRRGVLHTLTPQQLAQRLAKPCDEEALWPRIVVTPVGVDTRLPVVPLPSLHPDRPLYAVFLSCEYREQGVADSLLPVLLLSPMDATRASISGPKKANLKGGVHFYIIGDVYFVPPAVTTPRLSGHVFATFEDIYLGFPNASRLKRYHPMSADSPLFPKAADRRGIISPGFRVSVAPKASPGGWAYYQLSSSTLLDGGCWFDTSHCVRKLPPTHALVFTSNGDPDDCIIIRLGPCGDSLQCSQQSIHPSSLSNSATSSHSYVPTEVDTSSPAASTPSSRPLRAIVIHTCGAGHNDQCIPSATVSNRPTNLEQHTDHVATWPEIDKCFVKEFICQSCTVDSGLRVVLSIQSWWPSIHPPAYSDNYSLGVTIIPRRRREP
ncbi:HET-domain-containing protein [Lentinus tigrinus ALCF2SS1-7]|uniref:HET-domain-containing protein n=1 Tax=Lentinus tigrinus ALCF2SS1-6 TaxID=1328759 RepID=A0A5C2RWS3_9APHY|nr:HET-domain-containing protein [Lentinus tigrinus ALCF2SS1-6]RPD70636.1 HET-domain-containing protein [Lentinus tigrinus ALCF2SS1-7]